jgi:hypothetical protein
MDALKDPATGSMTMPLLVQAGLMVGAAGMAIWLRESPIGADRSGTPK